MKIKAILFVLSFAFVMTSCNHTQNVTINDETANADESEIVQEDNDLSQGEEAEDYDEILPSEEKKEDKTALDIILKEEEIPEILAIPDAFMFEYGFNSPGAETKDGQLDTYHVGNYEGNKYSLSARAERRKVRMEKWTKEDWELYDSLKENSMETITTIAREMSDKGWEDITCTVDNFPPESIDIYEKCDYFITKEEDTAPMFYVLEGKLYEYRLVIPVVFTEEHPNGKITRLRYDGGRFYSSSGYHTDEIFDPYDADMWSLSTAY